MTQKRIRFNEGQWFAVPLRNGGYAIGIIARGNNRTVCLGYFFGPKYQEIPDDKVIMELDPKDKILITQFGHVGITRGSWPKIQSVRTFSREEWPIPKFGMRIPQSEKGYIREYDFDDSGHWNLIREAVVDAKDIGDLPEDSFMGGGFVEILLTKLLDR